MAVNIYEAQNNGDLTMIAEIDDIDDPALAVDALLEEYPNYEGPFAVLVAESIVSVELDADDTPQPRRKMVISGTLNGEVEEEEAPAPRRRGPGRPRKADTEEAAPARRGPGRPKGSKNRTTGAKRGPGRPKGSKNKTSFRAASSSDDE